MKNAPQILYVDDDPLNIELFVLNFEYKYAILTATSGHEGLEILRKNPAIRLVISDMMMPNMNGIEFIVQAKKIHATLKCFILSGFDINDFKSQKKDIEMVNKFLSKPFDLFLIEKCIDDAIA